jgi:sigma-B regulation protein RsbU (phosphoserine phosphatase)
VRRLEAGGLVLGLFEAATFEEEQLKLEPGDTILTFSDGVSEALNVEGEEFGDDRLIAAFQSRMGQPLQQMLEGLMGDVRVFAGEALPNDDVTMLLLRYDGPQQTKASN